MLTEVLDHKATSFQIIAPAASCAKCISGFLQEGNFKEACGKYSADTDCKVLLPYDPKFVEKLLVPKCREQCKTVLPNTFKAAQAKSPNVGQDANGVKPPLKKNKKDIGSDVSGAVVFIRSFQDRRSLASFL